MTGVTEQAHTVGMSEPPFHYLFNAGTERLDVIWKQPDGTETVVGVYATAAEAMEHAARANNDPLKPAHGA